MRNMKQRWSTARKAATETGNQPAPREPKHMDVMAEYWADSAGMGNVSLLSTLEADATDICQEAEADERSNAVSGESPGHSSAEQASAVTNGEDNNDGEAAMNAKGQAIKRAMSAARLTNAKRSKSSQGEHIERGLLAVGDGLRSIGESIAPSTTEPDKSNGILAAIRDQTNSIQELLQYLKSKDL
jgi:hypothetical protein